MACRRESPSEAASEAACEATGATTGAATRKTASITAHAASLACLPEELIQRVCEHIPARRDLQNFALAYPPAQGAAELASSELASSEPAPRRRDPWLRPNLVPPNMAEMHRVLCPVLFVKSNFRPFAAREEGLNPQRQFSSAQRYDTPGFRSRKTQTAVMGRMAKPAQRR